MAAVGVSKPVSGPNKGNDDCGTGFGTGAVAREARVVAGCWESGIRSFLGQDARGREDGSITTVLLWSVEGMGMLDISDRLRPAATTSRRHESRGRSRPRLAEAIPLGQSWVDFQGNVVMQRTGNTHSTACETMVTMRSMAKGALHSPSASQQLSITVKQLSSP
jgi:hypothetical protein